MRQSINEAAHTNVINALNSAKDSRDELEQAIARTPSGSARNEMTDAHIQVALAIAILRKLENANVR